MHVRRLTVLLSALCLSAAALAPAGGAVSNEANASPSARSSSSGWTAVSSGSVDSLAEISTARTADGVVHAFYRQTGGATSSIVHTALTSVGTAAWHSTVVTLGGVASISPAMVTPAGGLRVVFGGLGDGPAGDGRAAEATSDASGSTWTVGTRALTKNNSVYAAYGLGATLLSNGTPVTATPALGSHAWRVGAIETTDPATRNAAPDDQVTTMADCCGYHTTLVNSGDRIFMAWYQNGGSASTSGIFVQQIHPTVGAISKAPGSSVDASSSAPDQSVAMVARPNGTVVVGYRLGYLNASIGLWEVGAATARKVSGSGGVDRVALSGAPSGRLWLGWTTDGGDSRFTRTGPTGLTTGDPADAGAPAGSDLRDLAIDGSEDGAVLLLNDSATSRVYAKAVDPPLTMTASKKKAKLGLVTKVKFKVTEGGKGVGGVKVKGGGFSCKTKAAGTCTIRYKPKKKGKVVFKAVRGGYEPDRLKLKVKG